MEGIVVLLVVVAGLALLGTAAILFGADSRPGYDERRPERRFDLRG
jgi:hypothetical protein